MARKLGDISIGLIILVACIVAFSSFLSQADDTLNVDSGVVRDSFSTFEINLSDARTLTDDLIESVDESSQLVSDEETEKENTGDEAAGILNKRSKNILTKFFRELNNKVPGAEFVTNYILLPIIFVLITIVFIRVWRGETKIWKQNI